MTTIILALVLAQANPAPTATKQSATKNGKVVPAPPSGSIISAATGKPVSSTTPKPTAPSKR